MDSKIFEIWYDAINRLKIAEKHLAAGEIELAKTESKNAATSGQSAITLLLRGREDDREAAEVGTDREFRGLGKDLFSTTRLYCKGPRAFKAIFQFVTARKQVTV